MNVILRQVEEISKIVGGKTSKRESKHSNFERLEIAEVMLEKSMTLTEASGYFDIPRSTIYENIRNIDDKAIQEQLDIIFLGNKG